MTNLQELIDTANKLSKRLEIAASEETRFCIDICMRLEKLSWETYRTANEIEEIRKNINYGNIL